YRALEKRPVGEEEVETLIEDIKKDIRSTGEREVRSRLIGEVIMKRLRRIDEVAFIRFASVYRRFEDITEFSEEVDKLTKD
ncbi:MAG: ATP cone domain-containing protein, partial [Candidatus Thioglobus sp.]|nr:ATP cone domain-containing protein [SAR86 cluster bacterium]MCS5589089.1 ATP cone domain-containing protein [Candidatus Thioglobus sp.]